MKTLKKLITTSRLKVWQACAMKHDLRYRKRLAKVEPEQGPTRFGSLWHLGQDSYWTERRTEHTATAVQVAAEVLRTSEDVDPFELAKCLPLLSGYHDHYWEDSRLWRVVAVEVEFRIPLVNPETGRASRTYELGGKIDLIVEVMAGPYAGFYVVEHKTSSEDIKAGSLYWRKLRLDDQITIYVDGGRSLGYPIRGVIYDVVQRPNLAPKSATPEEERTFTLPKDARPGKPCKPCKDLALEWAKEQGQKLLVRDIHNTPECKNCTPPKDAEPSRLHKGQRLEDETPAEFEDRVGDAIRADPDRYYRRPDAPIVRLEDELERMRQNIWEHCQALLADARKTWHPLSTSSCGDFHRLCDYFDLCTGDAEASDRSRFTIRESDHPELSLEIQTQRTDETL